MKTVPNDWGHPWMDWPDWKHRAWMKLHLYILVEGIKGGAGLTAEQKGCKEREALRTGRPQYDVAHCNELIRRADSIVI